MALPTGREVKVVHRYGIPGTSKPKREEFPESI